MKKIAIILSIFLLVISFEILGEEKTSNTISLNNTFDKSYWIPVENDSLKKLMMSGISEVKESKMAEKEVFLTFDDGPSEGSSLKILQILKEKNVKASFFVVGRNCDRYPELLKKLYDEKMAIVPHSYCHVYKIIYSSVDAYYEDLNKCIETIRRITGVIPRKVVRLPGGSDNMVSKQVVLSSIKNKLKNDDFLYVDWNVGSSDADPNYAPAFKIRENVSSRSRGQKIAVVLMHDATEKKSTVEALPQIIDNFKSQGYVFRTFDDLTKEEELEMIRIRVMNK